MSKKIKIRELKSKIKIISEKHSDESELEERIENQPTIRSNISIPGASPEELVIPVSRPIRVTAQTAEDVDSNSSRNVNYQSTVRSDNRTYSTAIRQETNQNAMALSSPEQAQAQRNPFLGQKENNLFAEQNRLELERQAIQDAEQQRRQYEDTEKERRRKHPGAYG